MVKMAKVETALGVTSRETLPNTITAEFVSKAYKARVLIVHPDKNPNEARERATKLFLDAQAAKEYLMSPEVLDTVIPTRPAGHPEPETINTRSKRTPLKT